MQVWVRSHEMMLSLADYFYPYQITTLANTCERIFSTYTIFFSKSSYFVYISSFTLFFIFDTGRSAENPLKQDILKSDYDLTTKGIKTLLEKHERA